MEVKNLGSLAYAESYALQERLAVEVYAGRAPETLLLLEHPPVYTVGRSGNLHNVLDPKVETIAVNRGGDVTFHCPGQLVGYPIIDLNRRRRDLHHYLRFLEEVLIQVAADFNVVAWRREGATGIWTEKGKLASIGAGARRWITMHGFALNVCNDLEGFKRINPCGIVDCAMVSLMLVGARSLDMERVKNRTASHFQNLLQRWLPLNAGSGG
ncbi:lipoyl(octanoyl) transferase [Syntrophotalea acetylenivorans]|uniref:Octanoyltransferase n=1 Tax=Syntrophotalea acetylenivorans TaxID=1842532 RepID=A0A1L3GPR2_9BACT|nr:lipoyl(octanoyl) transferase LipB [Syntrophotalea acetylenivorans]APG27895.1 lipoyl(octanoyl) transferase [Syntrophotalea acetylenivorans]